LETHRSLFAHYLDRHKHLDIDSLDEKELLGRWKSFIGHWNRGELSESWYDPAVFEHAVKSYEGKNSGVKEDQRRNDDNARSHISPTNRMRAGSPAPSEASDTSSSYGPPPPPGLNRQLSEQQTKPSSFKLSSKQPGPSIPTTADLLIRDADEAAERSAALSASRQMWRLQTKEAVTRTLDNDILLPNRAEPGSRERKLEKRRELNEKLREFRERSPGVGEVDESVLMGGREMDAQEEWREMVRRREERRAEKERRREEVARAKRLEKEEKLREWREKERRVLNQLREIARERFGDGGQAP